ncbi:uridine kinase [Empedobacter falsenii]|uniref:Uridine kinase n=2 Tax=Weeksellaceae TaxID=2762318 RepID=A0AAW7DK25_9FLAO|nr:MULTISPECIES: uridine kinase [Empedobacter]HAD79619.1 uridine kinase [Flavobacteriaceae bacterium]MDM1041988.1 uridine kinase [Empedobacter brevis]MDM1062609.1 uridine kinase [Empedobacter falsenii]MDM1135919.1 uridine kinase [Empedobacter sp. R750]MDM1296930.1 uridine kinase [Empedobacter falsenii]
MLVIGIAGGTGSGKTTVVNNILRDLNAESVIVISQDNYYKDHPELSFDERSKINFDHPRSIDFELLKEHVALLKNGVSIEQPVYSFITHSRKEETILTHPQSVIIVEGILVLTDADLRDLFDVKIFVHADSDERLIRRVRRDIQERGRDLDEVLTRYQKTLKPMHQQFIEPSKNYADIIIPNMKKKNSVAIKVLSTVIKEKLNSKTTV